MAAKSQAMESAVVTMRKLTADDRFRLQCEAREVYETDRKTWQGQIRRAEAEARQQGEKARQQEERANKFKARAQQQEERANKSEAEYQRFLDFLKQNPSLSAKEILKQMVQQPE